MIFINADDWGRSPVDTDRILACFLDKRITSTSAMLFMADSERAAEQALRNGVEVGLHLNFSENYTGKPDAKSAAEQARLVRFITTSKYALIFYHPWLRAKFRSVYQAQREEFLRLYGKPPAHIDGHQHMHLCANMIFDRIIPEGQKVRRNFTFVRGEKGYLNRRYRRWIDSIVVKRYRTTDYFFSLEQRLREGGLASVVDLGTTSSVEIMTHPRMPAEYDYLTGPQHLDFLRVAEAGRLV